MRSCQFCGRVVRFGCACLCAAVTLIAHGDPHTHDQKNSPLREIRTFVASTGTSSSSFTDSTAAVGGKLVWFGVRKPSG
jgi:hypothetical protein